MHLQPVFKACRVRGGAVREINSLIKRSAAKLELIPGSLKARAYLKRIFMGRPVPLPSEITENMASDEPPMEIPNAVGGKRSFSLDGVRKCGIMAYPFHTRESRCRRIKESFVTGP